MCSPISRGNDTFDLAVSVARYSMFAFLLVKQTEITNLDIESTDVPLGNLEDIEYSAIREATDRMFTITLPYSSLLIILFFLTETNLRRPKYPFLSFYPPTSFIKFLPPVIHLPLSHLSLSLSMSILQCHHNGLWSCIVFLSVLSWPVTVGRISLAVHGLVKLCVVPIV